jgi:carboxymethylenebutenolidase
MKKLQLLFILLATSTWTFGQKTEDIAVCHTSATEKFAMFASNKKFNNEHPFPRAYVHVSLAGGKMITLKTADGPDANGYLLEAKTKTNNWIFVFQEFWGLNDNIKRAAEDLYNDLGNVNVVALDMYDGKVATDPKTAGQYMQEFKQDRGNSIVKGALAFAGQSARVGTVGWCFGGGQSMQAALTAGKQAAACVIYYGMPEEKVDRLKSLNCDVLDIWGTKDGWINAEVTKKFEVNMKAAGKMLTTKSYDADHGFANPSNPMGHFNEAAYKDAYKKTIEFFRAKLK